MGILLKTVNCAKSQLVGPFRQSADKHLECTELYEVYFTSQQIVNCFVFILCFKERWVVIDVYVHVIHSRCFPSSLGKVRKLRLKLSCHFHFFGHLHMILSMIFPSMFSELVEKVREHTFATEQYH